MPKRIIADSYSIDAYVAKNFGKYLCLLFVHMIIFNLKESDSLAYAMK
jgi:hypothetical protein